MIGSEDVLVTQEGACSHKGLILTAAGSIKCMQVPSIVTSTTICFCNLRGNNKVGFRGVGLNAVQLLDTVLMIK